MQVHASFRLLPATVPAVILAAVLAGCATPVTNLPNAGVPVAAYRDTIDLSGKLAVDYQKDGPQHLNAPFTWTQRADNIDVELFGPLRQTAALIKVTPQSATLTLSDGKPRVARDIDTLTAQALGWSLPVSGLRHWLQGHATDAQGKPFTASPANNHVVTRDGWRLRFVDWQRGAAVPMPRRIEAARSAGAAGEDLAITILLDPAS